MAETTGKASTRAKNKWQRENCDRINLVVKKGSKQLISDVSKDKGESLNGYIKKAIVKQVKDDTGEDIEL